MNVLSLFDGMSCGQIALNKANIDYDNYYSCEIDKHAIKVTQENYPKTIQLGDVTKLNCSKLPKINLLIGGSPCQGFSMAGKKLAFNDPRSRLFFEYIRVLKECKPRFFLLENVKMKQSHQDIISDCIGVKPTIINSNVVSAQNRVRLYWTNIKFQLPGNKYISIRDILETNIDSKYFIKDCSKFSINNDLPNKNIFISASRGRYTNKKVTKQFLEPRFDDKTNCLTSVQKDNLVIQLNTNKESHGQQPYQQNRVYDIDGLSPALLNKMGCGTHAILDNTIIRRLTPIECERLQTVPDGYTKYVSDSQRYKMLGNGFTVDIIAHILKNIKGE